MNWLEHYMAFCNHVLAEEFLEKAVELVSVEPDSNDTVISDRYALACKMADNMEIENEYAYYVARVRQGFVILPSCVADSLIST